MADCSACDGTGWSNGVESNGQCSACNAIDEVRAQMVQAALDDFPDLAAHRATLANVVNVITDGWRCEKEVKSSQRMHTVPDELAQDGVRYQLTTPFRPLNNEEIAEREASYRRAMWRPEDGPPPADIGVSRLLDQRVWWASKYGRTQRLVDMHPNHRENLYKMLMRNARKLHTAEGWRFAAAPDEIMEEFDATPPEKWLKGTPLMKRLRKLIKMDQQRAAMEADTGENGGAASKRLDTIHRSDIY